MIKTVNVGEKEVQFNTNFAWTFIYKSQFGEDPSKVLIPAIQESSKVGESDAGFAIMEELGFVGASRIFWAMARLADKKVPEFEKWVNSFGDDFNFMDIFSEMIGEVVSSCMSTKNH